MSYWNASDTYTTVQKFVASNLFFKEIKTI